MSTPAPNLVLLQGRKAEVNLPDFVHPPKHRDGYQNLPMEWQGPGLADALILLKQVTDGLDDVAVALARYPKLAEELGRLQLLTNTVHGLVFAETL